MTWRQRFRDWLVDDLGPDDGRGPYTPPPLREHLVDLWCTLRPRRR